MGTEGLINEYCNPCEAIVDGVRTRCPRWKGLEIALDGVENGLSIPRAGWAHFTETLAGKARRVDYQSIATPATAPS